MSIRNPPISLTQIDGTNLIKGAMNLPYELPIYEIKIYFQNLVY